MKKKIKIAVGMSGGVDSSVAAALLVEQGYEVMGVFLECWQEPGCRTDEDRQDALKVALKLGIPFKVVDFKREYRKRVIDWFYSEFRKGRTPNPDVRCNREIKFGLFLDWAMKRGFDYIGTGHYARVRQGRLFRGVDEKKDQTYFLALVSKKQLKRVMFPVGEMTKAEVRREAKRRGLHVWDKKDSTGICFVGHDYSFGEFLKRRIKEHEGEVVDMKGKVVGKHKGFEFYTIGQRHGFRVRQKSSKTTPLYVVSKDPERNRLMVGSKKNLERKEFKVERWQWIGGQRPEGKLLCRIRHQGRLIGCEIKDKKVELNKVELGVAEGQVCVMYRGKECLGGGVIS
jgi:tRNA-specific 2-thiouridylase